MIDAILYARYSTALQSKDSVEDQLRLLRQRADREGWRVIGEQADPAVSGTIRDRPGLQAAINAIDSGAAAILLAESLDRISRDQEDLAGIFKRIRFAGARIVTLSEGEVGAMHIKLGGTMSALFLEQLADKVRRGHVGRVSAGIAPDKLKSRADELAARREALLADQVDLPVIEPMVAQLAIIQDYLRQVDSIAQIVAGDREAMKLARPLLDSLVDFIEVAPSADRQRGADLVLHGELATVLGFAAPERTIAA